MSSFVRRIQRQLAPSHPMPKGERMDGSTYYSRSPARKNFPEGRGSKLGVKNPKDPCATGKRKSPKVWRSKANAPAPKLKIAFKILVRMTAAERIAAHKAKMIHKASVGYGISGLPSDFTSASVNRHTDQPHGHKREIARRLRQSA